MYIIQNILVSDDVTDECFACNLAACKGACCWEGDFGAPLEDEELAILDRVYPAVAPYLSPLGRAAIEAEGPYGKNPEGKGWDTTLVEGGACAFMTKTPEGQAVCGIERAYNDGAVEWKKPISCHLYPIRVKKNKAADFEALNYDRWDICAAACTKGAREKIRVFEFSREALTRKYGEEWYEELAAAVANN